MIVIEANLFRRRTIHERPLAQVTWRSEFTNGNARTRLWSGRRVGGWRQMKLVVGWISYLAQAPDEDGRHRDRDSENCCVLYSHVLFFLFRVFSFLGLLNPNQAPRPLLQLVRQLV